jgi:hypothetical protein
MALLGKAVDINDTRHHVDSTVRAGQVQQRGRDLGVELDRAAPSAKSPPVIAKPTYISPSKNLRAACYIATELAGLQGRNSARSRLISKSS